MPAIPALITAGASIGGSMIANKAAKSAQKAATQRSPEELAYLQSQTNLANQTAQTGSRLVGTAMPQIQSTIDYYRTLLDGSRAARMSAVSGEAQDTAQAFDGAAQGISSRLRGGEREQALAENSTAKAGQISRLVTGVRPGAAAALGDMGTNLLGAGQGFTGLGANINAGLLSNATGNRQEGYRAGQEAGQNTAANIGALIAGFLPMMGKIGGGGKTTPLVSKPLANMSGSVPLMPDMSGLAR